jgi:Ca2+-binding RTX toxin-like protein
MLARKQPVIESLESRRLMHGAAVNADGVLRIWGDDFKGNAVTVRNSDDDLSVDVSIVSGNLGGITKTFTRSFLKSQISSIWMSGGFRTDFLITSTDNGGLNLPMRADGRGGNDTITTGGGNDLVYAGAGNDAVGTGAGNDRAFGGLGDDAINTGDGNDRASGGWGNDHIQLQAGNDFARGDAGNDRVEGGDGNDLVFGCGGTDTLEGQADNDTLWGGGSDDIVSGGDGDDTLGGVLGVNGLFGGNGADTFVVIRLELNPFNDVNESLGDEVVTGGREAATVPVV